MVCRILRFVCFFGHLFVCPTFVGSYISHGASESLGDGVRVSSRLLGYTVWGIPRELAIYHVYTYVYIYTYVIYNHTYLYLYNQEDRFGQSCREPGHWGSALSHIIMARIEAQSSFPHNKPCNTNAHTDFYLYIYSYAAILAFHSPMA